MYSSVTQKEVQESIIKSFSCSKAPLRVLICTIAFGMGLACVDVTQIIRPASDVESYMQECGRAGRNGQQSSAVLCEEFRSEQKNISKDRWNIAFRGRVVEGLYCTLLTQMSLMSRVVHVVMFVLSLVCVLIVSVIVSPSA